MAAHLPRENAGIFLWQFQTFFWLAAWRQPAMLESTLTGKRMNCRSRKYQKRRGPLVRRYCWASAS